MSDTEAAVLLLYLENHPELTAAAALRTLQADGRISSHPSTSALSRLVRSAGLQRRERQRQLHGAEQKLKFDFFAPLECVQVDCMHALKLPDPNGRRRMAILLAFLDDATRRILYACWHGARARSPSRSASVTSWPLTGASAGSTATTARRSSAPRPAASSIRSA